MWLTCRYGEAYRLIALYLILIPNLISVFAEQPRIQLPIPAGKVIKCVQGTNQLPTHNASTTRYDVDLDTPNYQDDEAVAPISGRAYIHPDRGEDSFGNHVNIDIGSGLFVNISHLKSFAITDGQDVQVGQVIGIEGCTGKCTGDHIHSGMHKGDPQKDAGQSVSVVAERIWTRDTSDPNGQFRDFRSDEFIGDLNFGHSYESANTPVDNLVGKFPDGFHFDGSSQGILDCYLRGKNRDYLGSPFADLPNSTTPYVHYWVGPIGKWEGKLLVQNYKNAKGETGAIIAYQHNGRWEAYALHGAFWVVWSGSGGPTMRWNGLVVGVPSSDEGFLTEAGITYVRQDFEEVSFLFAPSGLTTQRSRLSLELIQRTNELLKNSPGGQGAPVGITLNTSGYVQTLGSAAVVKTALSSPTSSQVGLSWTNAGTNYYIVSRNGQVLGFVRGATSFADTTAQLGQTYVYAVDGANDGQAIVVSSNQPTVTMPAEPPRFTITATATASDSIVATLNQNTAYPYAFGYRLEVSGFPSSNWPVGTTEFLARPVFPSTTYTVTLVAYDAAGYDLGDSNSVVVTTPAIPIPTPTPLPTPTPQPVEYFQLESFGLVGPAPYFIRGTPSAQVVIRNITLASVELDRLQVIAEIIDHWGYTYTRWWEPAFVSPHRVINSGEVVTITVLLTQAMPSFPVHGVLRVYYTRANTATECQNGTIGMCQIVMAASGVDPQPQFDTVDPATINSDLAMGQMSVAPNPLTTADQAMLLGSVDNDGTGPALASNMAVTTTWGSPTALGIPALGPGESYPLALSLGQAPLGLQGVQVTLDATGVNAELNEANNQHLFSFTVQAPATPSPTPTPSPSPTPSTTPSPTPSKTPTPTPTPVNGIVTLGGTVVVYTTTQVKETWTFKNDGTVALDLSKIAAQQYLSYDTIYNNTGDKAAGFKTLGTVMLNPGQQVSVTINCTFSPAINPALYRYLVVKVDSLNFYAEANEANNVKAVLLPVIPTPTPTATSSPSPTKTATPTPSKTTSPTPTASPTSSFSPTPSSTPSPTPSPTPSLTPTPSPTPASNSNLTVVGCSRWMGVYPMIYTDVTIKNTGSVAITGSIGAQQWLSNDTVVDASDTPMGFKSYSATLLVGQSMTLRVAGTFQSTSPCKPFLVVKADPLNAVVESSESDNFGSTPFTGWSDRGCP